MGPRAAASHEVAAGHGTATCHVVAACHDMGLPQATWTLRAMRSPQGHSLAGGLGVTAGHGTTHEAATRRHVVAACCGDAAWDRQSPCGCHTTTTRGACGVAGAHAVAAHQGLGGRRNTLPWNLCGHHNTLGCRIHCTIRHPMNSGRVGWSIGRRTIRILSSNAALCPHDRSR